MRNAYAIVVLCLLAVSLRVTSTAAAASDDGIATTFTYTDTNATSVAVAGEFTNWNSKPMANDGAGNWSVTLYLKPGYYGYKLIVDNSAEWILDPKNPAHKLVNGVDNSGISVGGVQPPAGSSAAPVTATGGKVPVTFTYSSPAAKTVHVAGEFNSWLDNDQGHVTGHAEWQLQNDGAGNWKLTTALAPGKYKFKYVVDGGDKWDVDASKPASADGNSIIEVKASDAGSAVAAVTATGGKAPVTFTYSNPAAKTVHVAGEFNNWLDNDQGHVTGHAEWQLQNDGAGNWKLTTALAPGKYKFKYVVDGGDKWDVDASKPASADGNSIIEVKASDAGSAVAAVTATGGKVPVTFTYSNPAAKTVHVGGEFNSWLDNDQGHVTGHAEWQLQNDGAGNWKLATALAPGKYKFKYVVDGGDHWELDPNKPASTDGNSIIEVKASDAAQAAPQPAAAGGTTASGAGVTFTYADPNAKAVFLAGEFNNWSATANPMQKDATGAWTASVPLKPGRYQYKYVVDGNWLQDTANPDSVNDGAGNINSVKTVSP